MQTTRTLAISALVFISLTISGCSESSHKAASHEGHQDHSSHKMDVQVFENGRVVQFEQEAPVISLTDQGGTKVTNKDLLGKVTLINFVYTNCKETCPVMVDKFQEIAEEMKDDVGKNIRMISITMDPERDTPEILKEFARNIGADTSYWSFLTGGKEDIQKTLKDFSFFYQKNDDGTFGHANAIMLLDRKGVWKYTFNVLTVPVDIAIERIKKEI